ncbi:MAG: hypothetical protein COY46_01900 [Chloroflexi bacterium CG_4_10_14_0_8_um_filter_46_9]|nr:MAG: hypothetical protein COY46_01900 [Chloroflexi bacterium CG_4_10_14_0_8_um_filter_46_9]
MKEMNADARIKYAIEHTKVIRFPRQSLATFGNTIIYYYVVTELTENVNVVREGNVIAQRPRIVTPYYLTRLEGFSEQAYKYFQAMSAKFPDEPGIFYRYKNEPKEMNIVSETIAKLINKLNERIEEENNPLSTIIKGIEELWDVSLMIFIYELTRKSIYDNVIDFQRRGSLDIDSTGVPKDARNFIEELFELVSKDVSRAPELVTELNRWGVFEEYQDRFFALFQK